MNQTESLERQAFLWKLIEQLRLSGSWCGETHVQKAAFFVEELAKHPLQEKFILYKHGPYSFHISDELNAMQVIGFVQIEIPNPNYGPRLRAGEAGQMLIKQFGSIADRSIKAINFVASKLADRGGVSLEKLATALYFTVQVNGGGAEQRAQKLHATKPHIPMEQAWAAVKEVDTLLAEWGEVP